jgi:heme/copper-type cytochrome/quinol oxidase subunit 2
LTRTLAPIVVGLLAVAGCAAGPGAAAPAPTAPAPTTTTAPVTGTARSGTGPTVQTVRVGYAGGQVTGDTGRVPVPLGGTVEVVVTSDVADEIHLHGYDRSADVPAGGTATLTFTADVPGVFEIELEELGRELTQLQVS